MDIIDLIDSANSFSRPSHTSSAMYPASIENNGEDTSMACWMVAVAAINGISLIVSGSHRMNCSPSHVTSFFRMLRAQSKKPL